MHRPVVCVLGLVVLAGCRGIIGEPSDGGPDSASAVDAGPDSASAVDAGSDAASGTDAPVDGGTDSPACAPQQTVCAGACVNGWTDPSNCGGCGQTCGAGEVCTMGVCGIDCGALTVCVSDAGLHCAQVDTDPLNCGGCNHVCPAGLVCVGGQCQLECAPGLVVCAGTCINPATDGTFCGATSGCGIDGGSAGTLCTGDYEACQGGVCQESMVLCDGSWVDPKVNPFHCGASGDCMGAGAGQTCAAGWVCEDAMCIDLVSDAGAGGGD